MFDELIKSRSVFCTYARSAIYLSLMALDVVGKEVILPAFTCQTNLPSAVRYAGGIPVYVDVDRNNFNMSCESLKLKISDKTAVVITHCYYGGIPSNLFDIYVLAKKSNIKMIIDAAHSYGERIPAIGDVIIYSFSKFICNPGGGCAVFRNREIYQKALSFQRRNASVIHQMCMNPILFSYYNALINDRQMSGDYAKTDISFVKRVIGKLVREIEIYKFQDYYKENLNIGLGNYGTRMTDKQYDFIKQNIKLREEKLISKRGRIGQKLELILPNVVHSTTYPLYVIMVKDVYKVYRLLMGANINARYTWPVFQKYEPEQLTKNIIHIKKHCLLLDVDILDDEKIRFIELHKGDIAID